MTKTVPKRTTTKVGRTSQEEKPPRYELKQGTWSVSIIKQSALGQEGVHLEMDDEVAQRHAQQLCGSQVTVALITVRPMKLFRHQQKVIFVMIENTEKGEQYDRVVHGYINSYGATRVTYLADTQPVICSVLPRQTLVLRARLSKKAVKKSTWMTHRKCENLQNLKKKLNEMKPTLHIADLFRMEKDDDTMTWLQRVPEDQAESWLQARGMGLTYAPLGEATQRYRVLWDRDISEIEDTIRGEVWQPGRLCWPCDCSTWCWSQVCIGDLLAGKGNSRATDWPALLGQWHPCGLCRDGCFTVAGGAGLS